MKKLAVTLLLMSIYTNVMSGNYKILYLNSQRIKINEAFAKVGDTFSDNTIIQWAEDRQAMKVVDMDTNKRYLMVAKLEEGNALTAYDILTRNKHLSTHDGGVEIQDKFLKLEMSIADEYDLLDSIELPTEIKVDEKHYFLGSYKYGDTRMTKNLKHDGKSIIIDKTLFWVNGKRLTPCDITLRICYVDGNEDIPVFIKDNITIYYVPDKID